MNTDYNDIELIISKALAGEASTNELGRLELWRKADEANEKQYQVYKRTFEETAAFSKEKRISPINVDAEWARFKSDVIEKNTLATSPVAGQRFLWWKVAAVFALIAVAAIASYRLVTAPDHEYYADETILEVNLPDNTVVTLSAGSSLSYNDEYGDHNRLVELEGRAFFDVVRQEHKPFIINTDNATVTVLGTSFNVATGADMTTVTVTTGRVRLEGSGKDVALKAGDVGTLANSTIEKALNSNKNYLAWKTKVLEFEGTPLEEVIALLEDVYQTEIKIAASDDSNCPVTVTFNNQSLESVLKVLESTLNLTIERTNDYIEITEVGCRE